MLKQNTPTISLHDRLDYSSNQKNQFPNSLQGSLHLPIGNEQSKDSESHRKEGHYRYHTEYQMDYSQPKAGIKELGSYQKQEKGFRSERKIHKTEFFTHDRQEMLNPVDPIENLKKKHMNSSLRKYLFAKNGILETIKNSPEMSPIPIQPYRADSPLRAQIVGNSLPRESFDTTEMLQTEMYNSMDEGETPVGLELMLRNFSHKARKTGGSFRGFMPTKERPNNDSGRDQNNSEAQQYSGEGGSIIQDEEEIPKNNYAQQHKYRRGQKLLSYSKPSNTIKVDQDLGWSGHFALAQEAYFNQSSSFEMQRNTNGIKPLTLPILNLSGIFSPVAYSQTRSFPIHIQSARECNNTVVRRSILNLEAFKAFNSEKKRNRPKFGKELPTISALTHTFEISHRKRKEEELRKKKLSEPWTPKKNFKSMKTESIKFFSQSKTAEFTPKSMDKEDFEIRSIQSKFPHISSNPSFSPTKIYKKVDTLNNGWDRIDTQAKPCQYIFKDKTLHKYDLSSFTLHKYNLGKHVITSNSIICVDWHFNLLILGGLDLRNEQPSPRCYKYIRKNNNLCYISDLLTPRSDHSAYTFQNQIFVFGGITLGNKLLSTCEMFDQNIKAWTKIPPLPVAIKKPLVFGTIRGKRIYIFGGKLEDDGTNNCMYRYSIGDMKWVKIEITIPNTLNLNEIHIVGDSIEAGTFYEDIVILSRRKTSDIEYEMFFFNTAKEIFLRRESFQYKDKKIFKTFLNDKDLYIFREDNLKIADAFSLENYQWSEVEFD